jgi:uncharacterized protein (AIM24 family)
MTDAPVWYLGLNGRQRGPLSSREIAVLIRAGSVDETAYVYGPQLGAWSPLASVPLFAPLFQSAGAPPPPPPASPAPTLADQIDYEIVGGEMQYVDVTLDPGEACVAEAAAFFFMDPGIEIAPGSPSTFTNADRVRRRVAFAPATPGTIVPIDLREHAGGLLCQRPAFLCAAKGVTARIALQRRIEALGGDGFVLLQLDGGGQAFVHAGGAIVVRTLAVGDSLRVDPGGVVALEPSVRHDVQLLRAVEGAPVVATLSGPGRVWLQSLPPSRLAARPRP